MMKLGEE